VPVANDRRKFEIELQDLVQNAQSLEIPLRGHIARSLDLVTPAAYPVLGGQSGFAMEQAVDQSVLQ
jgi:hypothetical protein